MKATTKEKKREAKDARKEKKRKEEAWNGMLELRYRRMK